MKAKYALLFFLVIAIISCKKGTTPRPHPPSPPSSLGKLKDMNERNLPSPYYHFEYNDSGDISQASFSAGLRNYQVSYAGEAILKMQNNNGANTDRLEYVYDNGELVLIKVIDKTGLLYRRCFITWLPSGQLEELDWEVSVGNGVFAQEEAQTFSYFPDKNVKEIVYHDYAVGPQTEATYKDEFENYDDKVNADGFTLLHIAPRHLILLPEFKIQLNNPRRNVRTGDGVNYEVDYTYTYDTEGRPTVKTGDLLWTSGKDSGTRFQPWSTFSYYK